jgi:type II secretory pathway pseudopilin PulG
MIRTIHHSADSRGFSFVEAIFTIAIIGIMSSLVVAAISNASRDAHRVMARQQQAAVHSALTAWVLAQTRVGSTAQVPQSWRMFGPLTTR